MEKTKMVNRNKIGFTIIEIILYFGLFSIFSLVLIEIFATSLRIKSESQSLSNVSLSSTYLLSKLSYEINNADSITTPATAGVSSPVLTIVKGGVAKTFQLTSDNFTLAENGGAAIPLNSEDTLVDNLSFTKIANTSPSAPTIKFSLTVKSRAGTLDLQEVQQVDSTAGMRKRL